MFLQSKPVFASETQRPFFDGEFKEHPIGYSVLFGGGIVAGLSLMILFSAAPIGNCSDEKYRKNSEDEGACEDRVEAEYQRVLSTVYRVMGVGLITAGVGGAIILWPASSIATDNVSISLSRKLDAMLAFTSSF